MAHISVRPLDAAEVTSVLQPGVLERYPARFGNLSRAKFARIGEAVLVIPCDFDNRQLSRLQHHKPLVSLVSGEFGYATSSEAQKARELGHAVLLDKTTGKPTVLNDAGYLEFVYEGTDDSKRLTGAIVGLGSLEYGRADIDGRKSTVEIIRGIVGENFAISEANYALPEAT